MNPRCLLREDLLPKVVGDMLSNDATCATTLHVILLVCYGKEIYQLDPVELILRLNEDFHVELTEDLENKLNAILMATSTDLFYHDPEAFKAICNTLTEGEPGFELFRDELTVPELCWGVYETELNHGPAEFGLTVQRLIDKSMTLETDDPAGGDPVQYVGDYLEERRKGLQEQLERLGVVNVALPSIQVPETV